MQKRGLAIVTGGAKGIGRAISEKLNREGWDLLLVGRDEGSLKELCASLNKNSLDSANYLAMDLSNSTAVETEFARWKSKAKKLPLALVCNAGDYGSLGPIAQVDFATWKKSFDLNFFSVAQMVQIFVRWHLEAKSTEHKSIVMMSGGGLGSKKVWPGISAYATAKSAVYRFMETVHEEIYKDNFSINCVAPGAVKTGITDQAAKAGPETLGALYQASLDVQSGKGDPAHLAADCVAKLLSPECRSISGRLISAKWDKKHLENAEAVGADQDLLRLRRIDAELFLSANRK